MHLLIEPKMMNKEKHLWQFSFPFYVSILLPFVLFPATFFLFFFSSLTHGIVHCQKQDNGLSVDNQQISVFGVNVVHVWKDTVLV